MLRRWVKISLMFTHYVEHYSIILEEVFFGGHAVHRRCAAHCRLTALPTVLSPLRIILDALKTVYAEPTLSQIPLR